jgi:hypothetical protein
MFDLFRLWCGAIIRTFRSRRGLMLENLALRISGTLCLQGLRRNLGVGAVIIYSIVGQYSVRCRSCYLRSR